MFLNLKIINVTLFYKLKIIMGVLCLRKTKTYERQTREDYSLYVSVT